MPPSSRNVSEDPRTKEKAARLWADFQVEEQKLNDEFAKEHGGV